MDRRFAGAIKMSSQPRIYCRDRPIVRALRLPERGLLCKGRPTYYTASEFNSMARPAVDATTHDVSFMVCFATMPEEAVAAAADVRGFLGSARYACGWGAGRLVRLGSDAGVCAGDWLDRAWALGASGLNEIGWVADSIRIRRLHDPD